MTRLAIFATHPIQYQVPWFQEMTKTPDLEVKVFYGFVPNAEQQGHGFGVSFEWDIPMFSGYNWEVLDNYRKEPELGRFFGSRVKNVRSILKREKPDVVLITGWNAFPLLQVLFVSIWLRIPRLVRGDSNAMKPRASHVRLLHRMLMKAFTAFLYVGKSNRDFYKGYGVPDKKLFRAPHFIDNKRFSTEAARLSSSKKIIQEGWGVPPGKTSFLYAGKLELKKRIMDLLNAMKFLSEEHQSVHLLVVGDGELMTPARQIEFDEKLPVTFCGFLNQSEMAKAYVAADCLVLPSDYGETWGLVVNEAMAAGIPAIVSDRVGCGPDLVAQGVTGFQFGFGNVRSLAEAMRKFVTLSSEERAKMGTNAENRVFENYSVMAAVDGINEAIAYACRMHKN